MSNNRRQWRTPALLLLLSIIPVVAGSARIFQLATGTASSEHVRFVLDPIPVIIHIVGATFYSLLGALQFAPSLRSRNSGWHRKVGRALIPLGFVVALSGLWMTVVYPWPQFDGVGVYALRLIAGSFMTFSLLAGIYAIRKRDFHEHGRWMTRAYAIALGAGTQVLTHIPWFLVPGIQSEEWRTIFMGAGWGINLLVAEWSIYKSNRRHSLLFLVPYLRRWA